MSLDPQPEPGFTLRDPVPGDKPSWSMRVYHKPFVPWLWAGVLLMV